MTLRKFVMPLRFLSLATALCFCWSFMLASTVHAAVDRPPTPPGQRRVLSPKEMSQIVGSASPVIGTGDGGGSGGGSYTNPAATPGTPYSWEGALGGIKVGNGNKLTSVGIVGWTQRGGMPVDLTLNHNSESSRNGELGPKWLMSYDDTLSVDGSGNVTVYWGDGRVCTFMINVNGSTYTAPAGITDSIIRYVSVRPPSQTSYSLTTKSQNLFTFSMSATAGVFYLTNTQDADYNSISLGYVSGTNLIQTIQDATGRAITLGYTNNKITSVTDPLYRQWTLSYDGSGNLAHIYWPVVNGTTYSVNLGYDGNHNVNSYQDKRGNTSKFSYNSDNTIASEQDPYGNQTTLTYGWDGERGAAIANAVTVADANNHLMVYYIGTAGQVTASFDALNNATRYAYDASYNATQKEDANGYYWNYTFDGMGNVLTAKDPYSHVSTLTYNAHNKPLTITAPSNRSVVITYDANDNPTQVQQKDASGNVLATTTLTIGSFGLMSDKYDANNHHTSYTYDANGYLNSVTTPLGSKTQWTPDALGFTTSRTDAMNRTTTYTPDAWERVVTTTYPDNTTRTYAYDANNNLTSFTNALVATTRSYDADNRCLQEAYNGTTILAHTYDASGQKGLLSTTTDFLKNVHSVTYTVRNQLSTSSIPGQTASYTYDANGNQTLAVNPNGTRSQQAYDNANRQTGVTNYNSSGGVLFSFGYAYNADSQKMSGSEADGTALS